MADLDAITSLTLVMGLSMLQFAPEPLDTE